MSKRILKSNSHQRVALAKVTASVRDREEDDGVAGEHLDLEALRQSFDAYHESVSENLSNIQAALEDISRREAAARVGGVSAGALEIAAGLTDRQHSAQMKPILNYIRSGQVDPELKNSLASSSNPDGGYLIPQAMDSALGRQLRNGVTMRRLARVVGPVQGDYSRIINVGGTAAYWGSEGGAVNETAGPGFAKVEPPVGKIIALPKSTEEVLSDNTYNLEQVIVEDLGTAISELENVAFINGDGVGKPLGLLQHPTASTKDSARAFGTLQFVVSGAANDFATATDALSPADALLDVLYSLKTGYWPKASWLMNSQTARRVRKFKDMEGRYIWEPSTQKGQPPFLLGFPVEMEEEMPDVGAGAFPIAFGDFEAGYTIVDKPGTILLRDPYTQKGYIVFYTAKRVGGSVMDSNAIKLLKIST